MYNNISLKEATDLVAAVGDKVTVIVQGHMGCGKTSMLKELAKRFPDHLPVYCDMTTKDLGDLFLPKIKDIGGADAVSFVPNEELGFHSDRPVLFMADELGKAAPSVLTAMNRILLERSSGSSKFLPGSIVFATTNLGSEAIGDMLKPHTRNRVCVVKLRKPTSKEWMEDYAIHNDVHPTVIGAAHEYPMMFQDFEEVEDANQNHYIYHPKQPRAAFVTPRSLEKASDILKACEHLPHSVLVHALMGVVGEQAAMDITTMHRLHEDLPAWERIIRDPENAPLPTSAPGMCMLAAKAVQRLEKSTVGEWMVYLQRLRPEAQALWSRTMMSSSSKSSIVSSNRTYTEWCVNNRHLWGG